MLTVGGFSLLVVVLLTLILSVNKLTRLNANILKRGIPIALIALVFLTYGQNQLLRWWYPNNPAYVKAVLEYRENPRNGELREEMEKEREKMLEEK